MTEKQFISPIRLWKLQKQFEKNYEIARNIFYSQDTQTQLKLINYELFEDKHLLKSGFIVKIHSKNPSPELIEASAFTELVPSSSHQMHLRHNVYRTCAAFMLNASDYEKVIILARNTRCKRGKQSLLYSCKSRLASLDENFANMIRLHIESENELNK